MKNKLFILMALLLLILVSSTTSLAQNVIEERVDLKEEIIKLSKVFDFEEDELENVEFKVYQFRGTVEEALIFVEETLLKDESQKIKMEYSGTELSEMLVGIRTLSEYGVISTLDEEWIEASKVEEERLSDRKQKSYYGYLEYPDIEKDVSIENPYYNPITFRLEEGTYIIYSEYKLRGED